MRADSNSFPNFPLSVAKIYYRKKRMLDGGNGEREFGGSFARLYKIV
jgi:hypothetical protein